MKQFIAKITSKNFYSLFFTYLIIGLSFIFMLAAIQTPFKATAQNLSDCLQYDGGWYRLTGDDAGNDNHWSSCSPPTQQTYQAPVQQPSYSQPAQTYQPPPVPQVQCYDDLYYCDNGRYIHKHRGYPGYHPNAVNGCVYAFDDVGQCPGAATPLPTPTPYYTPIAYATPVTYPYYQYPSYQYGGSPYLYSQPYSYPNQYSYQTQYGYQTQYSYQTQPVYTTPYPTPYPTQQPVYSYQNQYSYQSQPPVVAPPPAVQPPVQQGAPNQTVTNTINLTQNVTPFGDNQQPVFAPQPTPIPTPFPTPVPTPFPTSTPVIIYATPVPQVAGTSTYCPPGMQASFEDARVVCRLIPQPQPVVVQAVATPFPTPIITTPQAQYVVGPPPVTTPTVVYQQAQNPPVYQPIATTYPATPVPTYSPIVGGVTELPKTGLPLAAWIIFGSVPIGLSLRRFGSRNLEKKASGSLIWEERHFKSI